MRLATEHPQATPAAPVVDVATGQTTPFGEAARREHPGTCVVYTSDPNTAAAIVEHRERELGQRVVVYDPRASGAVAGSRYNPLVECGPDASNFARCVETARMLSEVLLDRPGHKGRDHDVTCNVLQALLLYVAYSTHERTGRTGTLSRVAAIFRGANDDAEIRHRAQRIHGQLFKPLHSYGPLTDAIWFARETMGKFGSYDPLPEAHPDLRRLVVDAILDRTEFCTRPVIRRAIAAADWRVGDLLRKRSVLSGPTSVVLLARPRHTAVLRPLMRLLLQHIAYTLRPSNPFAQKGDKPGVLVQIDGTNSLGRMEWFERMGGIGVTIQMNG